MSTDELGVRGRVAGRLRRLQPRGLVLGRRDTRVAGIGARGVGTPFWGSWSWGAGGLASLGRSGTRPVPTGSRSVQMVSASFVRVPSLRARGLEGEGCACAVDGYDGIRGAGRRVVAELCGVEILV